MGPPITQDATCSWVAPATTRDGDEVILKLGYPHMEGMHEIDRLEFWNGDPTAALLRADRDMNALLLERCSPGRPLCELPPEAPQTTRPPA